MDNASNQQNQVSSLRVRRVGIEVYFITIIFFEKILDAAKLEASKNSNNRLNKKSSKKVSGMIHYRILVLGLSRKEGATHPTLVPVKREDDMIDVKLKSSDRSGSKKSN